MTARETSFQCSWTTPEGERRIYVRAWSRHEALALAREEVAGSTLPVSGDIRVVELGKLTRAESLRELADGGGEPLRAAGRCGA
jgi:hypothetical protein